MWHIEEEAKWLKANAVLDESKFGQGFPGSADCETKTGHAFYELIIQKGEVEVCGSKKKISLELDYITAQMGEKPILAAVTALQFQSWSKAIIIAIPAKFRWKP